LSVELDREIIKPNDTITKGKRLFYLESNTHYQEILADFNGKLASVLINKVILLIKMM